MQETWEWGEIRDVCAVCDLREHALYSIGGIKQFNIYVDVCSQEGEVPCRYSAFPSITVVSAQTRHNFFFIKEALLNNTLEKPR